MTVSDLVWWVMSSSITLLGLGGMAALLWFALSPYRVARTVAVSMGDGTFRPLGAAGAPPSRWSVHLVPGTGWPAGEVGTLEIANGRLSYWRPDATEPEWWFPAPQIRAQHHVRFFHPATVDLWLPTGFLSVEVDRTRIRPWLRSNFASIRRPREAHVFLQILGANGAVVSATPRWPVVHGERLLP